MVSVTINYPTNSEDNVEYPVELSATIDDADDKEYEISFYGKKKFTEVDLRIVVLTDIHYDDSTTYQSNLQTAVELINDIHNTDPIDLVVFNGDIVHDNVSTHNTIKSNYMDELNVPHVYATYGNWDRATESEWQNVYGFPRDHSLEIGDYGIILLRTSNTDQNYLSADNDYLQDKVDEFSDKKWVFAFQHIAPFEDTDNYGVDSPDIRQTYADTENVAITYLGHNHNKNWIEENDGHYYSYGCRVGGIDLEGADYPSIEGWGIRMTEVYDNRVITSVQRDIDTDEEYNNDILYEKADAKLLERFRGKFDNDTLTVPWADLDPNETFHWWIVVEEVEN